MAHALHETVYHGGRERLFTGYTGRILVLLTLGAALAKFAKFVLPPLLPAIIADLSITPVMAGLALSLLTATSALLQYPSGRISDKLSRKTVLVASLGLLIVGSVLLASSPTYAAFVLGVAVVGAGDGLFHSPARALLSDFYSARRGEAFGIHLTATDIAGVVAAGAAIVAVATWRLIFLPVLLALVLVLVAYHTWSRGRYVVEPVPLATRETAARLFRPGPVRRLILAYAAFMFVFQGLLGFLPLFLQTVHGFSPAFAAGGFALLFAVGLVVKPVAGELGDRWARTGIVGVSLVLAAAGIVALLVAPTAAVVVGGIVLLAVGQKAFSPPMQAALMDAFPDESRGGDLGAARTAVFAAGSLGPAYVGVVAGALSYQAAFAGFVACIALAVALVGRERLL